MSKVEPCLRLNYVETCFKQVYFVRVLCVVYNDAALNVTFLNYNCFQ